MGKQINTQKETKHNILNTKMSMCLCLLKHSLTMVETSLQTGIYGSMFLSIDRLHDRDSFTLSIMFSHFKTIGNKFLNEKISCPN